MPYHDHVEPGPEGFKGDRLDRLLATGYFRYGTRMEASDIIFDDIEGFQLIWKWVFKVRIPVARYRPTATTRNIRNRCAGLTVGIVPGEVTAELEGLYARYRASVDFELPETCRERMLDFESENPFDSRIVELRDGGRLVGAGFLDIGRNACMGVMNIFDPDYRRCSPGKYLIDRKIEFARENGLTYFHPGSVIIGDDRLDYKLSIAREVTEAYLPYDDVWVPFAGKGKEGMAAYLASHFASSGTEDGEGDGGSED